MVRRVLVSVCVVALMAAAVGNAATTGRMKGTVLDNEELALPGVTVQISSDNLIGGAKVAITDGTGTFIFSALPVGMYTVEASLVGFRSSTGQVRVQLDRTAGVTFTMTPESFGGEVEVVAQVPVVDTAQVNTSQVFDQNFLQNAAVGAGGRSYQSIVGQAAGTGGGSNPNVFGGLSSDNNYLVDGISTTDPVTQTFGTNFNYDAIQEVSIMTGGYEAEFGQATGGVINLVTKSGGNDFSGSVDIRYRDQGFTENGDHFDKDEQDNSFQDYSGTLGGPILRDKLWFFTSFEYVKTEFQDQDAQFPRVYEGSNYIGKLTWQIANNHRAVVRYSGDPAEIPGANSSQFVSREASYTQEQGGDLFGIELNSVLSESVLLNFRAGMNRGILDGGPTYGDEHTSMHFNNTERTTSNNYVQTFTGNRDRDEVGLSMTWFLDQFAGSHEFKFGAEYTKQQFDDYGWYNGGGYLTDLNPEDLIHLVDRNGDGYLNYQVEMNQPGVDAIPGYNADGTFNQAALDIRRTLSTKGDVTTFYAQDAWRLLPNLTIKPGVRFDNVKLTNAVSEQVADMDRWQPRIGLAWDIDGSAKYVARASWGRFMDPTALTIATFASGTDDVFRTWNTMEYLCNRFPGAPSACSRQFLEAIYGESYDWINGEGIEYVLFRDASATVYDPAQTLDQAGLGHLEAPYSDHMILAFEMQVAPETSIELTYVDKRTEELIEDTCVNNAWVWDSSVPRPDINDPTTWTTAEGCTNYVIANHDYLYRQYNAYIAKFETRGARWHGLLSWTNSESEGNSQSTAAWSYARGDIDYYPVNFYNIDGYLSDHRENRLKLSGYWLLPGNWTVGFDGWWSDAGHITTHSGCDTYLAASDEVLEFYGVTTDAQVYCTTPDGRSLGGYDINLEPRGNTVTKSVWNADLSVTKGFSVGSTDMSVILSVYNLFGRELDTSFNSTAFRVTDDPEIGVPVDEGNVEDTLYVPIGQPLTYGVPRRYELGFRLTF